MPRYLVALYHPNDHDPSVEGEAMRRDIRALNVKNLVTFRLSPGFRKAPP